ncbi:kinase-like domain-containing protein [Hysterangium stoloniferum]|nr:kinase-like domain-containing protein [Hysterangium stoloniferum]
MDIVPAVPVLGPSLLESFSKSSSLCLDGRITECSKYPVVSGGYADIRSGKLDGRTVAIKTARGFTSLLPMALISTQQRAWREYLVWKSVTHPNIHPCLGYSYGFSPDELPALISPWASNGHVLSYIARRPNVDPLPLIFGIADGLAFLHDRDPSIVHGDIRGGNILVSDQGIPCLTDFGISRILGKVAGLTTTSSNVAGSLRWMSRELLNNERANEKSDVWAFGMTVLEILTKKQPYSDILNDVAVLPQIMGGIIPRRPGGLAVPALTDELWSVCSRCWEFDPTKRPAIQEIKSCISNITPKGDMEPLPAV